MGRRKKTQTTKVWERNTLAPFQAPIFITAAERKGKPGRSAIYADYVGACVREEKLIDENGDGG